MAKENPRQQKTEMGNKRRSREVKKRSVVDIYDDGTENGKEIKWCKGCGGIFFTEDELKTKHKDCDPNNPESGVKEFLK